MSVKTLTIDGVQIASPADSTILVAADEAGIKIPTLCHLDGLSDLGACRLCLVEIVGTPKLHPACMLKVQEGMEIRTNSERLRNYRKMILELLFAERNHVCSVCVSNGHCDLQDLALQHGITHVRYEYLYPKAEVDCSHPRFVLDHNRCILCQRCVRVCGELEGAHTKAVMGRGVGSRIIDDLNQPWGTSETCTSCGKCVQVCPTGALSEKGVAVGETIRRRQFLPYLKEMRRNRP
jgi:bidirectional [NiFe] hydrogenase diaphorase subunit